MKIMKKSFVILTSLILFSLSSCGKDDLSPEDEIIKNSLIDNPEQYGKPILGSEENVDQDLFGEYIILEYTSDTPVDWNGDGQATTNMLTELDLCQQDNALFLSGDSFRLFDRGVLCEDSPEDPVVVLGDPVVLMGTMGASFDDFTQRYSFGLFNEDVLSEDFPFPSNLKNIEIYFDGDTSKKTLVANSINFRQNQFDIVVMQQVF